MDRHRCIRPADDADWSDGVSLRVGPRTRAPRLFPQSGHFLFVEEVVAKPAQGQIVPDHLIGNRTEYDRLLTEHFACVSPKAVNQMLRALDRPSNRLWTEILAPNLLLDA